MFSISVVYKIKIKIKKAYWCHLALFLFEWDMGTSPSTRKQNNRLKIEKKKRLESASNCYHCLRSELGKICMCLPFFNWILLLLLSLYQRPERFRRIAPASGALWFRKMFTIVFTSMKFYCFSPNYRLCCGLVESYEAHGIIRQLE